MAKDSWKIASSKIEIPEKDIDLEKLGLINQGLFAVDGELASRYHSVLKQVFDLDCDVDNFRIDKRGLSPELCVYFKKKYPERFEFGDSFLNIRSANRFMIIISPDQKDAPLVAPQSSYDDSLCDEVYRQARHTVEDITTREALFGEFENGIRMYDSASDLLQFRTVEISLDTLDETVKNFFELKKMSDDLDKEDNALNSEYITKMQGLAGKVGDIRKRYISKVFPITKEIHCFYVEFFKGVHCLRNFRNKDEIRGIFISHEQGNPKNLGEEIVSLDLHDKKVLDLLHKYKFLRYNGDLIPKRLQELEDEALLSEGIDVIGLIPPRRKAKILEHSKKLPESYRELRETAKLIGNTSTRIEEALVDKSYETRLKLSEPASKADIINHMLAEIDPTDAVRVYEFNRRKLITEFPSLPTNRQRYIAYTILDEMKGGNK
jgi:hypothetical protein